MKFIHNMPSYTYKNPMVETYPNGLCGGNLSLYVSVKTGVTTWICDKCNDQFKTDGKFTPDGHCIALSMFAHKIETDKI